MLIIYPTETVTLTIPLYYAPEEVAAVTVEFEQNDEVKLTRSPDTVEDGDEGGGKFTLTLDPDETALFEPNRLAHYQVRVDLGGIYDVLPAVGFGVLPYVGDRKNKRRKGCCR